LADKVDTYWSEVDRELQRYPAVPDLEPLQMRSTDFATVYGVRLTSLGPYRIFGYYSVPVGDGPFPGLLQTPRYGSVNHVPAYELRQRYAVLTIMHRGQRLADQPFAAAYPGLLTLSIDNPARYIYRGIVADCLRAAEFLLSRAEVDAEHIGIVGDDLALLTAARRPGFTAVQASGLLLYRLLEASERTHAYPIEEVQDVLRAHPQNQAAMARTLALFDPLQHAPRVSARTLLTVGDPGALGGPEWLQPLAEKLQGPVEQYRLTHQGRTDHDWIDAWLAQQLRPHGAPVS
jgi:cephalosporin-C deacetylase-like acetyl esterase